MPFKIYEGLFECFRKKRNIKTKVLFMNNHHELLELWAKLDPTNRSNGI